jgi:hypothetical protein
VGGLPVDTTAHELREAFTGGGTEVGAITLVRNRATGLPRGFAFVTLLTPFDVAVDRGELDGMASTTLRGRRLAIQAVPARPQKTGRLVMPLRSKD